MTSGLSNNFYTYVLTLSRVFWASILCSYYFREIRLDIHVLNHEGNVADCAGVAGLAALAHFKRPDVTLEGDVVTVGYYIL